MSHYDTPSVSSSSTNPNSRFQSILGQALQAYKDTTGKDLPRLSDQLFGDLSACDSPGAILVVLQKQLPGYDQLPGSSQEAPKWPWLNDTVDVLNQVLQTIGSVVGIVSPSGLDGTWAEFSRVILIHYVGISSCGGDLWRNLRPAYRRFPP